MVKNLSQATDSAKGEEEAMLLHHKLNLLTGLVQDMVPIVITLQEAQGALLLQDVDDADNSLLQPRADPQLDKQPSFKMIGE